MRRLLIWLYSISGLFFYYRKKQKSPIVLFWHGVSDKASPDIEGESFPVTLFLKQIRYLKHHYEIISMDEYYERYKNHTFNNHEVVITFDDGYKNNLTVAAPILKSLNIPFTVFISAQNVETQERFYVLTPRLIIIGASLEQVDIPMLSYSRHCTTHKDRVECAHEIEYRIKYLPHEEAIQVSNFLISLIGKEKYSELCQKYTEGNLLSWQDVITLSRDFNCTIGSHCLNHCICHQTQDKEIVKIQIEDSKHLIENRTGFKCEYFAYPNGDYTDYSNKVVAANYKMGFSTERIHAYDSNSLASIGRIGVSSSFLLFKYAITMGAKQFR